MNIIQKIRFILTPAEQKRSIVLLCLMVVGTMLEMLGVGILFPVMILVGQNDFAISYPRIQPVLEFFGNPAQGQLIAGVMLVLVTIYLIKNLFLAFLARWQACFVSDIQEQLADRLFTAYLRQSYTFHLQRNSTQLGHNIAEVKVFTLAVNTSMTILTEGLALLGITTLLLLAEPLGVLIVMLMLGAAVWSFNYITRARVTHWGVARQYHERLRNQHMYQGLGGIKDVKLIGRESHFLARFQLHNAQWAKVVGSQAILQQLPRLWLELVAVLALALLVLSMLGQGVDTNMIVPTLGLFAAAAFRLIPSFNRILSGVQSIRYSLPSVNLMYDEAKLIVAEPSVKREKSAGPVPTFQVEIRLTNISYTYPSTLIPSVDNISITIQKGESVGFIGPSGSGKSTLIDVILGLLPPSDGQVMVDGEDIQTNLRAWQNQIGYVPQTIYLTDDTLRHNVAFGLAKEEIDDAAVRRAIKHAQLEKFVASLPKGLETVVGERGIRLSGGQRQRIGIARALYHDPAVLVLDEATSALDTATEHEVMQAVTALKGSKTMLIVAHRLSTVEHCDRLYRLEHGHVQRDASVFTAH
jgi:ABC-type multidrug transport system fused ATPase/permease subunit